MKNDLKEIGSRIRKVRGKQTLEQFSALLGISKSMVSKYENGDAWPKPEILFLVTEIGRVSFDWLFTGKEEQSPPKKEVIYNLAEDEKQALTTAENIIDRYGLANRFQVTEIYRTDQAKQQLTDEENRLITAFRALNEKARKRKLEDMEELAGFIKEEMLDEEQQQKNNGSKCNNASHVGFSTPIKK